MLVHLKASAKRCKIQIGLLKKELIDSVIFRKKSLQGKNVRNTVPSLNLSELSCPLGGDFTTQVLQTDRQTARTRSKSPWTSNIYDIRRINGGWTSYIRELL